MTLPKRITILGGGLSGLTAAYKLSKLSPSPSSSKITLIESTSRIGGWINTQEHQVDFQDEYGKWVNGKVTLESGPRSIRPRGSKGATGMLSLLRDLNLIDDIIPIPFSHPAAKNRFLLNTETSRLVALPSSPLSLVNTKSSLLKGLLPSILKEPFKSKIVKEDESVDSFFERRFSPSIARSLGSSMVHGIYAASSKELSLRSAFPILHEFEKNYGSVVLGMLRGSKKDKTEVARELEEFTALGDLGRESKKWSLFGLKNGLSSLTQRLYEELEKSGKVEFNRNESIQSLKVTKQPTSSTSSHVDITTSKGNYQSDHIISALSPSNLSTIIDPSQSLPHLNANPYTSVGVVNLVYPLPPSKIHPEGFGYLIPRPSEGDTTNKSNPYGILGVIFDSTAVPLPGDVKGITKLTIMMGGPYWSSYKPLLSPPESEEELIQNSINHLNTIFPQLKNVKPLIKRGKVNYNCIPTYLPNHGNRLKELHSTIRNSGWRGKLSLIGNGYGGVGVNDCIYSADQVVAGLKDGGDVTGLERWENWE